MPYLIPVSGVFFSVLYVVCMRVRVGSAFYRVVKRGALAACLLIGFSLFPFSRVGVNPVTLCCVAALGAPGLGLLQVIALIP